MGPRHTAELIEGGEKVPGIGGVHGEVYGACFRGVEEYLLPGVAPVFGAVDATLRIGAPGMAEGGYVDRLGSAGWMRILAMCRVSLRPTLVQVWPPSVDLYTPSPWDSLL